MASKRRSHPKALVSEGSKAVRRVLERAGSGRLRQGTHVYRDPKTGAVTNVTVAGQVYLYKARDRAEPVTIRSNKGQVVTIYRNASTGSFTTQRSTDRIRETSSRAADSLRRLAKR